MHFFTIFNDSILPIFLIIILAVIYNRVFKPEIQPLANLALALFAPVLVFDSMTRHDVVFSDLGIPFVFMLLLTGLLVALGAFCPSRCAWIQGRKTPLSWVPP